MIEAPPSRIRQLERGAGELSYLEGLTLAKGYLLCPTCFARHFRGAVQQDAVYEGAGGTESA